MKFRVNEIFESINGEGLRSGQLATFVRLHGCNLACRYCDTRYACDGHDYREMTIEEILAAVERVGVTNVTLTGGEPLIQDGIEELVKALCKAGYEVEVETNGAVDIHSLAWLGLPNLSLTLDYKTAASGMEDRNLLANYKYVTKRDSVKFVVGSTEELDKVRVICNEYKLTQKTNVIISPVFGSIKPETIVAYMRAHRMDGTRFQLQIHKVIWNPNRRGV